MQRLKSRQKYIPNGFKFYQPETGWKAPANASFEVIVNGLISHRKGRPDLVAKHKWSTDHDTVADEVDDFNAKICIRMGWMEYVRIPIGEAPPPKFPAPSQQDQSRLAAAAGRVKKIWSGVRTLNDWIDSGESPVPIELAVKRAATCSACPSNTKGDFTRWFTAPAAEAIRRQVEKVSSMKLSTPHDEKINVCEVCLCPLKLKVHTPIKYISAHMSPSVLADLEKVKGCWIVEEV